MHKVRCMCKKYREIRLDIAAGRTDEALAKLDCALATANADAVNSYLAAEALDPESPAAEARAMLNDIFAFYNKDMYNQ